MTSAIWSRPLFDIDQMRQIRYPLPIESISDETAAEIIEIVETAIPVMAAGESPYQVFPKFPDRDLARATAFRFESSVCAEHVRFRKIREQKALGRCV